MSDEFSPFDKLDGSGIDAYVIDQGKGEPRMRGYALGTDLAANYRFAEVVFLALVGDFPGQAQFRAFELALVAAMDISIGDAAVHAARLSRHLADGAKTPMSVVGTAGIALAEMSRTQVEELRPMLDWLDSSREEPLPAVARAAGGAGELVAAVRGQLDEALDLSGFFDAQPSTSAAAVALMWAAGLRTEHQIATALTMARLPVAIGEAFEIPEPAVWKYPLNLPFWDYRPDRVSDE